jgi:DNA-binding MarR family transcriptional regulator
MSTPAVEVPDSLVLAAIERAALHRADGETAVPAWAITEHLGIPRRSRGVRAQIATLEASGAIERSRRHGIAVLSLTSAGKRRLARSRRTGTIELPESPQHAKWRNARILAEQEIDRFRAELIATITDAMERVERESHSDLLFEIAERLHRECWRLGSATYCLREWPEPSDASADIDERLEPQEKNLDAAEQTDLRAMRAGRRNVIDWDRGRA